MHVGVVLPAALPGVDGETVLEWARMADAGPFSSIAVPDRLDYQNFEPLMTLAAAAAVTTRVKLVTTILLAPERSAPWVVKEIATLTQFAPGRVVLGIGVGARPIDYERAGVPWDQRGRILDEQLDLLETLRDPADPIQDLGPRCEQVPILIGGASKGALRRLVKHGDGYVSGGVKPEIFGYEVMATKGAWAEAGKPGEPQIVAGTWYSSPERFATADANREHYFVKGGPPPFIRDEIRTGRDALLRGMEEFAAAGATEIIWNTMVTDVAELEWLMDALEGEVDPPAGPPQPQPAAVAGTAPQ